MTNFPFTKSEVITNLGNFSQNELQNYASNRNFDYGSPHHNVSKILLGGSLGFKNVLNFTYLTMKFHNRVHVVHKAQP